MTTLLIINFIKKYKFIILLALLVTSAGWYLNGLHNKINDLQDQNNKLIVDNNIKDATIITLRDAIDTQNNAITQLHQTYKAVESQLQVTIAQERANVEESNKQYDALIHSINGSKQFNTCDDAVNHSLDSILNNPWRKPK